MKLSELKTRLKNKYVVRIVAGVLTIALLGSSMTAVAVQADQKKDAAVQTEQKEDSSDKKDDIEDLLQVSVSDKEIGKDENVYLISDATGSVYDTIVTDHLINKNQSATLEDQSNLTDIKNVKGSEEFSQNGEKLTWQADGADIYYQGKTDRDLPIEMKMTYYLDGEEITPEELAGKSGKVTIRADYTNKEKAENGVYVPFAAVTGMMLNKNFTNVEVTNGKFINDGDRSIYSFVRWSPTGKNNLLFVCNFTPVERPDYMCGVPRKKQYRLILDSSDMKYGGPTEKRQVAYRAKEGECDGQPYRIAYALPAYGVAVFSF